MTASPDSKSTVIAAVVQMTSADDVATNLAAVTERVAEARRPRRHVDHLAGELRLLRGRGGQAARGREHQRNRPGPDHRTLVELAARHRVHLVGGGLPERSADAGRPYNCSLLVGPGGVVARYRKIHLFDVDLADGTRLEESRATHPGEVEQAVVAGIAAIAGGHEPAFTLGLSVCYDLRFPELYRAMSRAGARVLTVPAAFTVAHREGPLARPVARARHRKPVLPPRAGAARYPSRAAARPTARASSSTRGVDVLAQASDGSGIAVATLDFVYQDKVRAGLPALRHARFESGR